MLVYAYSVQVEVKPMLSWSSQHCRWVCSRLNQCQGLEPIQTLTVFHITSPRVPITKGPVFVLHGVLDSADTWVLNSAEQSLAFILAEDGYEVFLGNSRGSK